MTDQPDPPASASSFAQILRATSITGGAQGITLLLGMLRVKFAALLIGAAGVGLLGNLQAIQALISTVAGFGLQTSGVRTIAAAHSQGDRREVGSAVQVLRLVSWVTGALGAAAMLLFSPWLSRWSFGSEAYSGLINLLAGTILLSNLAGAQTAVLQGTRQVGALARLTIATAVISTLLALVCYRWLGVDGIVPVLLLTAAAQGGLAWWSARQVALEQVRLQFGTLLLRVRTLLELGLVFMATGLIGAWGNGTIRALLTQHGGLEAVGIYGAAYALSAMPVTFILGAMGADYYPRLTGHAAAPQQMVRLVNQQAETALLLALPGLMLMLSGAPYLIELFYSREFVAAVPLLQWFVLGSLGRIISWPLGFVMPALARGGWYFLTEASFTLLQVGLVVVGIQQPGIEGTAIAFAAMYAGYIVAVQLIARRLIGFRWTRSAVVLQLLALAVCSLLMLINRYLAHGPALLIGVTLSALTALLCLRGLLQRLGANHRLSRLVRAIPLAGYWFDRWSNLS